MEQCATRTVPVVRALLDNLPYIFMIALGAAVLWLSAAQAAWRWPAALLYGAYGVAGALWIMLFVCPWCHFYDTRQCPCGYGRIAARLRGRQDASGFARQFRQHIPLIVPLWFVPLLAGGIALLPHFSAGLLALLTVFAINSFVVLPLVSRKYGCATCPQKAGCSWMGTCKSGSAPRSQPDSSLRSE
jgi:hypothetical protein